MTVPVRATALPSTLADFDRFQELWRAQHGDVTTSWRPNEWQAATALVVAPNTSGLLHFSVIKRVARHGDPWSGQMALPGGKRHRDDDTLATTARRETFEEVGLALDNPLGGLPATRRRSAPGTLATFVFTLPHMPAMTPEPAEVAAAWWCPVTHLTDPSCHVRYRANGMNRPAIAFANEPIWGLTYRTLQTFAATHGITLPDD